MAEPVVTRNGRRFVLVEERRWKAIQAEVERSEHTLLPEYPAADAKGNRPAVAYARVSIARKIITARRAAGLTQAELAKLAGIRQETICRLESGKHSPTIRTVEKIDRALKQVERTKAKANAKRAVRPVH